MVTNLGNAPVYSDAAKLKVKLLPPEIAEHPVDAEATEYQPASFTVVAEGTLLEYQWQRSETETGSFVDIGGGTESTYTIQSVQYEDGLYLYRCRVTNLGNDPVYSSAVGLKVNLLPPVVTQQPTDTEVTEKQTVSFTIVAEGTLKEYQWQKKSPNAADFEDISGATESQYTLPTVEYSDRGQYRCVVTNPADRVNSFAATLTVRLEKPVIQTHPVNLTIDEGDPAEIAVEAQGTLLNYQWQRKPHGEDDFVDIVGATTARYTIAVTTLNDHGTYRCFVSNIDWPHVPSDEALLFVEMKVPENTTPISNPSAGWINAHARLAWNSVEGFAYRVYQGISSEKITAIADSNEASFIDTSSKIGDVVD